METSLSSVLILFCSIFINLNHALSTIGFNRPNQVLLIQPFIENLFSCYIFFEKCTESYYPAHFYIYLNHAIKRQVALDLPLKKIIFFSLKFVRASLLFSDKNDTIKFTFQKSSSR